MKRIVLLALTVVLVALPLRAEAHHRPTSYCSSTGDICQSTTKVNGIRRLRIDTVRQVLRPVPALRESSRWLQGVSRLRDPGIGVALRLICPVGRQLPAQGPRSIHGVVVDRWAGGGTGAGVPQAGSGLTRAAVRSGPDVRADPALAESRLVHGVRDPRDDAARDGARRDQPLAGVPRLLGSRGDQGGRPEGDRRRHQPVPDHVGRRGVPRGDRPELPRALRDDVGRGRSRHHRHVRLDRGDDRRDARGPRPG